MPKSPTWARPSAARKMFAGLISRWTMPCAWAACSPRALSAVSRKHRRGAAARADTFGEGAAGDELLDEIAGALRVAHQIIDGDEVGVAADAGSGIGLAGEAFFEHPQMCLVSDVTAFQSFDRNASLEAGVEGADNDAESPRTKRSLHPDSDRGASWRSRRACHQPFIARTLTSSGHRCDEPPSIVKERDAKVAMTPLDANGRRSQPSARLSGPVCGFVAGEINRAHRQDARGDLPPAKRAGIERRHIVRRRAGREPRADDRADFRRDARSRDP